MAEELANRLRGNGYRMTPQRQMVLDAVEALGHATPDEIHDHLEGAVNTSTVYRNLEVLQELGLVRHAHLTDRAPTYHSSRQAEHFHLVCRQCRDVVSAEPAQIGAFTEQLRTQFGFTVDVGHLTVFGLCAACTGEVAVDPVATTGHGHGHGH